MKTVNSLLMIAVLLLSSFNLNAQNSERMYNSQGTKSAKIYSEIVFPQNIKYNQKIFENETLYVPVHKLSKSNTQNLITLTFRGVSKSGIKPVTAGIFNKEFKNNFTFDKGDEQTIQVPQGTYDMFVQFKRGASYYVFKENLDVKDGDVIEFDQEEAVNDITYSFLDESCEELYMDVYDGNKLIRQGNADNMTKITSFNNKEYGTLATILSKGYMPMKYPMEFYVNNLSDRYVISNGTNIIAHGTTYTYKDAITKIRPETLRELGGENLKECTTKIDIPNLMNGDEDAFVQGYTFTVLFKGLAIIGEKCYMTKNKCPDKIVKNMMSCPESDENSDDMVNVIYQPALSNYYEISDNKHKYFGIRACAMIGDKNGIKYINAGQDTDWGGQNVPEGERVSQFYPGHPEFSYENTDGIMTIGNCCPAIGIRSRRYKSNGKVKGWTTPFFTGRYGERYESDAYILGIEERENEDGKTYGKIVDNFAMIDGMSGKNTTEYLVDLNNKDFIAPTLQMVSFKNADGVITDRIKNSKGSKLIFTGGDFDYVYNKDVSRSYYKCTSADVTVCYSLHGEDNWKELTVFEIPEKKFMPYFGNFYEVPLDEVVSDNDNQWFDISFYMEDVAGNYQKQIISPAFMIKEASDTGINDVYESNIKLTVMGDKIRLSNEEFGDWEIHCLGGSMIHSSYSNEISIANLPAGVYIVIVKTNSNGVLNEKIVVK